MPRAEWIEVMAMRTSMTAFLTLCLMIPGAALWYTGTPEDPEGPLETPEVARAPGGPLADAEAGARGVTLVVDISGAGDFTKIGDAVQAASDNGTILIRPGEYHENLILNKSLILRGVSNETCKINGSGNGTIIQANAEGIVIQDLTIENTGDGHGDHYEYHSAIQVGADSITITDCIFRDLKVGILFWGAGSHTTVQNCHFIGPYMNAVRMMGGDGYINTNLAGVWFLDNYFFGGYGIVAYSLKSHSDMRIEGNSFLTGAFTGISFSFTHAYNAADRMKIIGNLFQGFARGIGLGRSFDSEIYYNTFRKNDEAAIYIYDSSNNTIHHNTFIGNGGENGQSFDDGASNNWNDTNGEGNYWDDYEKRYVPPASNDGVVWSDPYELDGYGEAADMHPLVERPGHAVDTEPPVLKDLTSQGATTGDPFIFKASASDASGISRVWVEYWYDDLGEDVENDHMELTGGRWERSIRVLDHVEGNLRYVLHAADARGNAVETEKRAVSISDNDLPHAVIWADKTVPVGSTRELGGNDSWDNVGIVYYNWTISPPGTNEEDMLSGEFVQYSFYQEGTYSVNLWVSDRAGNDDWAHLWVEVVGPGFDITVGPVAYANETPVEYVFMDLYNGSIVAHRDSTDPWGFATFDDVLPGEYLVNASKDERSIEFLFILYENGTMEYHIPPFPPVPWEDPDPYPNPDPDPDPDPRPDRNGTVPVEIGPFRYDDGTIMEGAVVEVEIDGDIYMETTDEDGYVGFDLPEDSADNLMFFTLTPPGGEEDDFMLLVDDDGDVVGELPSPSPPADLKGDDKGRELDPAIIAAAVTAVSVTIVIVIAILVTIRARRRDRWPGGVYEYGGYSGHGERFGGEEQYIPPGRRTGRGPPPRRYEGNPRQDWGYDEDEENLY